ncbi:MAG: putative tricarboxylic transport rane protein [Clostridia bacterium]|nr:putative tricarboxylic transport rane protein [Clostridia bacterium]
MKISSRWGTTTISLIFITLGITLYIVSLNFPNPAGTTMGPGYMPRLLSSGLIIFALVNLITAWLKPDTVEELPEIKLFVISIVLSLIYAWVIAYFNYYLSTFLLLLIMFLVLNKKEDKRRACLEDVLYAVPITIFIYLVFGLLLDVF